MSRPLSEGARSARDAIIQNADEFVRGRFWSRTRQSPTGCILWLGALQSAGYGHLGIGGRNHLAHRVAYIWSRGSVPNGRELDHLCRVTRCVNPEHLEPVTHRDNCLRGVGACATNARKTHCSRGHEFSESNTIWHIKRYPGGKLRRVSRGCLNCRKRRQRERLLQHHAERRAAGRPVQPKKGTQTHCPQGHPYDAENTVLAKSGGRVCLSCRRARNRRVASRRKSENAEAGRIYNGNKTHCKHGHEFTPDNTRIRRVSRARVCRSCERERSARRRPRHTSQNSEVGSTDA